MIKVCHIVNLITGKSDGVYAHLKMIFQNSDKTMFQHYLIFQGGEKIERELTEMGVKVFVSGSLKKKVSVKALVDIYSFLKENNIDIIHTHLNKPYALSGLVNILLRKKFILNYHGIFLTHNPYYNLSERIIYSLIHFIICFFKKPNAVLVPSRKSKQLLIDETKLFPEPVVYYNGYSPMAAVFIEDNETSKRIEELKKNKKIIAVVGRLEIQKRVDNALLLFKMIKEKRDNVFLMVFGDGSLKNELNSFCNELDINSDVIFFDYVQTVSQYFNFFDVLLFTSDWEGMPLTMWEAMANQLPVVAPDVGGFKEILEEYNCGIVYEPGNLKQAEEKILEIIDDNNFRLKLGANGKLAIEKKFNEKQFIDQIEKIYLDLLSS